MTSYLEDITAPSYKGRTQKGICPECGNIAEITRFHTEEPSWCSQPDVEVESEEDRGHMVKWKELQCLECGSDLIEGDDFWICPDCNNTY